MGPSNTEDVWQTLYGEPELAVASPPKLSPGDYVKLSTRGLAFERGYTPNWSIETFKVRAVRRGERPVVYVIEDHNGDAIRRDLLRKTVATSQSARNVPRRTSDTVAYAPWCAGTLRSVVGLPDSPAFNSWVADMT